MNKGTTFINYSKKGKFRVSQIKYLVKVCRDFPELIPGEAASPAADHLFTIRDEDKARFLPEEQVQVFHRTVEQLLFIAICFD